MDRTPLQDYLEQVEKQKRRKGTGLTVVIVVLLVLILLGLTGISAYLAVRLVSRRNVTIPRSTITVNGTMSLEAGSTSFPITEPADIPSEQPTGRPEDITLPTGEATKEQATPATITMRLDPGQAAPGSMIEVTGSNWPPNQDIRLTFFKPSQGQGIVELDPDQYNHQTTADENGTFQATLTIPDNEEWRNASRALVIAFTTDRKLSAAQELVISPASPVPNPTPYSARTPLSPVRVSALTYELPDQNGLSGSPGSNSGPATPDRFSIPFNVTSALLGLVSVFIVVALSVGASIWFSRRQWQVAQNQLTSLEKRLGEARREMTKQRLQHQIALDLLEDMTKIVSQTRAQDEKEDYTSQA